MTLIEKKLKGFGLLYSKDTMFDEFNNTATFSSFYLTKDVMPFRTALMEFAKQNNIIIIDDEIDGEPSDWWFRIFIASEENE